MEEEGVDDEASTGGLESETKSTNYPCPGWLQKLRKFRTKGRNLINFTS